MDLGAGSFVFSQSVVFAMQLIKDSAYLTSPVVSKFIRDSQIVWVSIFFFTPFESLFLRSMRQNMDDTGIFSSLWRFFLSFRFYFIMFFYIFPQLLSGLSEMPIFYYISRHSAPGALCRHHDSTTFLSSVVERRYSSTSEKKVIQQPLVVITSIWISQHPH